MPLSVGFTIDRSLDRTADNHSPCRTHTLMRVSAGGGLLARTQQLQPASRFANSDLQLQSRHGTFSESLLTAFSTHLADHVTLLTSFCSVVYPVKHLSSSFFSSGGVRLIRSVVPSPCRAVLSKWTDARPSVSDGRWRMSTGLLRLNMSVSFWHTVTPVRNVLLWRYLKKTFAKSGLCQKEANGFRIQCRWSSQHVQRNYGTLILSLQWQPLVSRSSSSFFFSLLHVSQFRWFNRK